MGPYQIFAAKREHDIIEHTRGGLAFLTNKKINLPAIWGTSEESETSELEYLTRRIKFCPVYFCLGIILKVIQYNFKNNA